MQTGKIPIIDPLDAVRRLLRREGTMNLLQGLIDGQDGLLLMRLASSFGMISDKTYLRRTTISYCPVCHFISCGYLFEIK